MRKPLKETPHQMEFPPGSGKFVTGYKVEYAPRTINVSDFPLKTQAGPFLVVTEQDIDCYDEDDGQFITYIDEVSHWHSGGRWVEDPVAQARETHARIVAKAEAGEFADAVQTQDGRAEVL